MTAHYWRQATERAFVSQDQEDRQQLYGDDLLLLMTSFPMSARVSEAFPGLHDKCFTVQLSIKRTNE